MSGQEPGSNRPNLSVIQGGGESRFETETFLDYARRLVREALGNTPEETRTDHLSVVPPLPEGEPQTSLGKITLNPGNVLPIHHAPGYRRFHPEVTGTGALSPVPAHIGPESGLVDAAISVQRRMEQEAREDAERAHRMGPEPLNPEDFLQ